MTVQYKLVLIFAALFLVTACDKASPGPSSSNDSSPSRPAPKSPSTPKPTLPIPVDLTIDQIRSADNGQVEQFIFDAELKAIGNRFDWEAEIVTAWPAGLKMLYATWVVETEVNNGGFEQYFANTEGRTAEAALEGFKLVGAKQHARLLAAAMAIRAKSQGETSAAHEGASRETPPESSEHTTLDGLDSKYYGLKEDLSALRVRYIRAHPEAFVTKS